MTRESALGRVKAPGTLLIINGVLGILYGLLQILSGTLGLALPQAAPPPPELAQFQQAMQGATIFIGIAFLPLGAIMALGGQRMMNLQSYGLAIASCVISMLPCVGPNGCCICVPLGWVGGIWGLVVLLNKDVAAAFRGQFSEDGAEGAAPPGGPQ